MTVGFMLLKLTLTGPDVPNAELQLTRGLNVVTGPSDTGKTYIAQCVDFVMGSGTAPKEIPEAAKYTTVILEIEPRGDASRVYVLRRALRGGDITLSTPGAKDRVLGAKHQANNEDTVSSFLLEMSGLQGKRVRTNQHGSTRPLSFRDIARLIMVSEESVISTTSPVLSGQHTARTSDTSVFRLLLTGTDDSSVIAKEEPKVAKGRQEGKAEVLEALLLQSRNQLDELAIADDVTEVRKQLDHVETVVAEASQELTVEQSSAAAIEEDRRRAWARLREAESRADVLSELQKRFHLLEIQYSSDLRRLEAIAETALRLEQMTEERCPVCGAPAEHHESEHQLERAALPGVAQACAAEAEKTARLLADLQTTLASNASNIEQLNLERSVRKTELVSTATELKNLLQPRIQVAVHKLRENQERRDAYRRALELLLRSKEFEEQLAEVNAPRKRERIDGPSSTVSSGQADQFSKDVEVLLRSWRFPGLDRVTFSEDDQDIVVSGRHRGSHGKGVRAILRAAFNLALLRLCTREEKPFPGFLLIDSPLVVYREPDTEEGAFPPDVKDAFYRSLATEKNDIQVIVLENDEPPTDVRQSANCVSFTGTSVGRNGFIPSA